MHLNTLICSFVSTFPESQNGLVAQHLKNHLFPTLHCHRQRCLLLTEVALVKISVKTGYLSFSWAGSGDLSLATIIKMRSHPRVICCRYLWNCCKLENKIKTWWQVKIARLITVTHLQVWLTVEVLSENPPLDSVSPSWWNLVYDTEVLVTSDPLQCNFRLTVQPCKASDFLALTAQHTTSLDRHFGHWKILNAPYLYKAFFNHQIRIDCRADPQHAISDLIPELSEWLNHF